MRVNIYTDAKNPTMLFAKSELLRYIHAISDGRDEYCTFEITIEVFSELLPQRSGAAHPFDDEILINIREGSGFVAGINPRSCLLAVYRLLREVGCRFLRPGKNGEFIPNRSWCSVSVQVDEKPSYRHRGICIEGAVSRELYLDMIDWLPKNGMNAYFIQFRSAHTFFERWYAHKHNPNMPSELKTAVEIRDIVEEGIKAIKLRDMIYHEVGHGWTCEPFGIPGQGWDVVTDVKAEALEAFALVGGRRELWGGIPLNTNLCYGNKENRDIITESIVSYIQKYPQVDILHFWLADGMNNHCECPLCVETRPSDFYVEMLNCIDERLTELGFDTRIAFLIYFDLLWLPEKQRIHHPDRFILMFAPITRTYSKTFAPDQSLPEMPEYERNRLAFPTSVEGNVSFLKAWQTYFAGDSFDYDYHLLWHQYKEPGLESLAKVLHDDIQNLQNIGLNGLISCQVQRSSFPSPMPMGMLAQTLWNRETNFDTAADDLYAAAYGTDGANVRSHLLKVSDLFHAEWFRQEEPVINSAQELRMQKVPSVLRELRDLVSKHSAEKEPCQKETWRILGLYCTYVEKLSMFCLHMSRGHADKAEEALNELIAWAFAEEENLGYAFDCDTMRYTLQDLYKLMIKSL